MHFNHHQHFDPLIYIILSIKYWNSVLQFKHKMRFSGCAWFTVFSIVHFYTLVKLLFTFFVWYKYQSNHFKILFFEIIFKNGCFHPTIDSRSICCSRKVSILWNTPLMQDDFSYKIYKWNRRFHNEILTWLLYSVEHRYKIIINSYQVLSPKHFMKMLKERRLEWLQESHKGIVELYERWVVSRL